MKKLTVTKKYFGLIQDDGAGTIIYGFENITETRKADSITIPEIGGGYGYVNVGKITVIDQGLRVDVHAGSWFSFRYGADIIFMSGSYRVAIWQRIGYYGMNASGLVETFGRLNYIDGCKDTMLCSPIMKGNPCLNALYMPENVHQTMHTHPSTRSGFIFVGGATAITLDGEIKLEAGMIFFLPAEVKHKFRSDMGKDIMMKLVAYHPDSDFGATDEVHPMINRTIVDGVSASDIKEIQTKNIKRD